MKIFFILFIFSVSVFSDSKYNELLKNYKTQIDEKTQNIEQIKKEINHKKQEKEKYKTDEKYTRKQLQETEKKLSEINSTIDKTMQEITDTKEKLKKTEKLLAETSLEIVQITRLINSDIDNIYREYYSVYTYFSEPILEYFKTYIIDEKIKLIKSAESKNLVAKYNREVYLQQYQKLHNLNADLEKQKEKQKELLEEKKLLIKTIHSKIVDIEEEIKQLNISAKELQNLIFKLEQDKKQTLEMKKKEEIAKKKFQEKKGNLPWPVKGEVIANFGKIKDAEFGTYIISNGIKIKSQPYSDVQSIDNGNIVYAKNFRSYGKTVIIDHCGNYSIYGNLGEINVKESQNVSIYQIIGKTSETGILYFELKINKESVDPINWLEK